jgi:methionyl-tRNA synthetase
VADRVFYLTTPIYYINAPPHLGHAYTTILADTMARWRRLQGDDVRLLTGTDEHGDKIAQAAAKAGVSPKALADTNARAFRQAWDGLGIRYDDFIRTTEPRHARVVQAILQTLYDKGEIYLGRYGGHYCFGCERFYTEKEIVDGKCPDHQTPLTWIEEENYFFKMSRYQGWLIEYIARDPNLIRPERYRNEILGFLREPLLDLSISRPKTRLQWGIPLPFDDRFVTYVWFDALINYLSALGMPGDPLFERYWPHVEHLIGKDILKPHAVYWPCMLKAYGEALGRGDGLVYRRLNVHGYWNIGGAKMSKSVGNVVEALALKEKYGNDAFRYFVMREPVFGLDADFSEEAFVGRYNADLANDLGNLVSRATTLIANHAGIGEGTGSAPSEEDLNVRHTPAKTRHAADREMDDFAYQRALAEIWEFIAVVNRYVDKAEPWKLAKDPTQHGRLNRVLLTLADSLRCLGILLDPFLPEAAGKVRSAVGSEGPLRLDDVQMGRLLTLPRIQKLSGLFPRVVPSAGGPGETAPAPRAAGNAVSKDGEAASAPIAIEDFARVDLRVAEVVAAEPVPKSDKLLKLTVAVGGEQRTVVAGIAEHYSPTDLVGKRVVIVANLQPRKLRGIESQGMILAGEADGRLAVLIPDRELPPGAKVK